jgi:VWFA-related protein
MMAAAVPVSAQPPTISITPRNALPTRNAPKSNVRVDVQMVLVPVTVTDKKDRPITDLTSDSFRLFEDGVEQKIVSLSREEGPVSIGIIFDASGSMKNRMEQSVKALDELFKGAEPGDEFLLVRFNDRPTLEREFTPDPGDIRASLSFVQPIGWTALHDAICLGVQHMKSARNKRKALLVLTDGGDNNSRYTEAETRSLVREADVRVYSIGLNEKPSLLEKLAEDSGGRAVKVHHLDDLPETVDKLSQEIRSQYVLGYSSNNEHNDGKYRKVMVAVKEALRELRFNVFWRRGYIAPE